MLNLRDLSFRYKIPLRSTVLVFLTAVPIAISTMLDEYEELKRTLVQEKLELSRIVAENLVTPMSADDVWHCYQTIQSITRHAEHTATADDFALVLDAQGRVYVASDPLRYPIHAEPVAVNAELATLRTALARRDTTAAARVVDLPDTSRTYVVSAIVDNGVHLGDFVLTFSNTAFLPQFYRLAYHSAFVALLILAILLPVSWYWAHRMAKPLVQLAQCMGQIGPHIPADLQCTLYESKDEIGRVGVAFRQMFAELRKKEYLEKQMAASERLAAVGRLSAGIAHEINNPLGGMLNAINTFKRHGNADPLTTKTLSLLERGLLQIRDTVAALLVETKVESNKLLTRQDIEDTHTLVLGKAKNKSLEFLWRNEVVDALPLPSTLVRQVTINLLLNAIHAAADTSGRIECYIHTDQQHLFIMVRNNGRHIAPEQMEHLFEPFSSHSEVGHGLGLWVTYQAVRQMGGGITVESEPDNTSFVIALPLASTP